MNASAAVLLTNPQPFASTAQAALQLRVYQEISDLQDLRPAWDDLLSKYPLATTFSTWEWLTCWWRAFGGNRQHLVLCAFDESNSLIGLAPFSLGHERHSGVSLRILRMMGDGSFDSDNLDLPVVPGFEEAFAQSVIWYLNKEKSHWDLCELNTLPVDSPAASHLSRLAKVRRWAFSESFTASSAIQLPATWDAYLAMLSSEDRKNLPRYTRRLQNRHAMRIYRCDANTFPECLESLYRLHQARWESVGEAGSFSSAQRRNFYWELSCSLLKRGWLELWVLELDSETVAVQFAFRYGDRVFQLQEGYDHRRSSDRPGYVLRGEVLKTLIREGVRVYDFLGGEDQYKARWAAQPGMYRTIRFAPRLSKGGILLQIRSNAGAGKQWLRCNLPKAAWGVLHDVNAAVGRLRHPPTSAPRLADIRTPRAE